MRYIVGIFILLLPFTTLAWGFFAHEKINRLAVFTLPAKLCGFYKSHIEYITKHATRPDKRRYVLAEEAPRHFIDIDVYGDSAVYTFPRRWKEAVEKYGSDTLEAYGVVPFHVNLVAYNLIQAFKEKNVEKILNLSTDIGHYIADANVPLHTTENYNGQLTGQRGIHGFWESRLPELFFDEYDLLTGQAVYVEDLQSHIWEAVIHAHEALDTVLSFEKMLSNKYPYARKYSFEEHKSKKVRVYSYQYAKAYHTKLNGMVERRMRASIKMIGNFWLSCWIKAGQPDLSMFTTQTNEIQVFSDTTSVIDHTNKYRNHEAIIEIKKDN